MPSDLVVFGEDWGGLPSSTQHLIKHLRRDRKVLWVNSIGLRKPRLSLGDGRRLLAKIGARRSRPATAKSGQQPGFTVTSPLTIPAPANQIERYLSTRMLQRQLLPQIEKAGLTNPVLWLSLPTAVDLVGKLGESATVYYCGDDFSALAGVDHDTVSKREDELHDKADLIITASARLQQRFPASKSRLLNHGVDYSLFANPCSPADDLPDGKPVAGFYGSLSEWLDLDLLKSVIGRMPHWNFVFIGQANIDLGSIETFPNVFMLGPKPHQELPRYSQHWNVSLLPFRDNAQIRACNPLKLAEYLAAGSPVVSTSFPALSRFPGLVEVCEGVDSMVQAIESTLAQVGNPTLRSRRQQSVAPESWEKKAEQINQWLESL